MKTLVCLIIVALSIVSLQGCRWLFSGDDFGDCPGTQLPPRNTDEVAIEQGIWGDVWFWEGDFQPLCPTGTVTAVAREMRIYEMAGHDDVDQVGHGAFYSAVHTPLVAVVQSAENGFFEVALQPGSYSVFAVEDTLLYANGSDGYGNIYPVMVDTAQVVGFTFDITYCSTW